MELRRCWCHSRRRYPDFAQNCNPSGVFWAIRDGGVAFFAGFDRFWWFLPTTLAVFWAFDAGGVLIFSELSEKQLEKRLKNFQKNASQNLEFNIVVQFLIFYRQFSTFYAFAFCSRLALLVLFCTIGFVSHYQFVQLKIFEVHQLQPQTHLVLLLYFDSTAELPHLHTTRNSMKSACCSWWITRVGLDYKSENTN